MASPNPLTPIAELALERALDEGRPASAKTLHAIMGESPESVMAMFSAMDNTAALQALRVNAVAAVLKNYGPAVPDTDEVVHVQALDNEDALQRRVTYLEGMLSDLAASRDAARDRLSMARLRREMDDHGVPEPVHEHQS